MRKRNLGTTGLQVSEICLGTMTYGEQTGREDAYAQMDYARENGINFFDTAELYAIPPKKETMGATETIIGEWLKSRKDKEVIIATKLVGRSPMTHFRKSGEASELTKSQMMEALEGSLKRLGVDCIDYYQVHFPDRAVVGFGSNPTSYKTPTPVAENSILSTLETFNEMVKQGKVKHIGVSNETAWGVMSYLKESQIHGLPKIQGIQNAYNFINRTFEVNLAEITERENVGLLAYSPLAQGFLTGKYLNGARPAGSRSGLFNRGQRYEKPGTDTAINAYLLLAKEVGIDPIHLAINYVTSRSFVTTNIIGATTMEQLKHIVKGLKHPITPEIEAKINAIHQVHMNPAP